MEAGTVKLIFHICFLLGNLYLVISTYRYHCRARLLRKVYSSSIITSPSFNYGRVPFRALDENSFTYEPKHGYTLLNDYQGLNQCNHIFRSPQRVKTLNSFYLAIL